MKVWRENMPAYVFYSHRNIVVRDYLFFLNIIEHIVGHVVASYVSDEASYV